MATVVNNPSTGSDSGGNFGMIFMAIILLVIALLFIFFGLPMLRRASETQAPSITIPDQIDVNVNNPSE